MDCFIFVGIAERIEMDILVVVIVIVVIHIDQLHRLESFYSSRDMSSLSYTIKYIIITLHVRHFT